MEMILIWMVLSSELEPGIEFVMKSMEDGDSSKMKIGFAENGADALLEVGHGI